VENCDKQVTTGAYVSIGSIVATFPLAWLKFRYFCEPGKCQNLLSFLFVGSATLALIAMAYQYGRTNSDHDHEDGCHEQELEVILSLVLYAITIPFGHAFKSKKNKYQRCPTKS